MNHFGLLVAAYLAFAANNFAPLPMDSSLWAEFKQNHSKSYESEQVEEMRRTIFARNSFEIRRFNERADEAEDFQLGLNHLADMSSLDMKEINGFRARGSRLQRQNHPEAQRFLDEILNGDPSDIPDAVDWRNVPGRVSRVKNQGQCGSCWAFAAVGALEGQEKARGVSMNGDSPLELSEQNLVDCVVDINGDRENCGGGLMADAFDNVKQEGGIESESDYPYVAANKNCRFNKTKSVFTDAGHVILPEGREDTLKAVVAKFGPVAVAIDASSLFFQFYHKGVYKLKHCGKKMDELDHGVLVVGYGTDPKKGDYWIVKNSWGPKWGEHGYIRMARNNNNMCGIATVATLPTF